MADKFMKKCMGFLQVLHRDRSFYGVDENIVRKKLNLNEKTFDQVKSYLNEKGYAKEIVSGPKYKITDKGFEFLFRQKDNLAQKEFNRIIALTGAIIALVYFYNFVLEVMNGQYKTILSIVFLILLIPAFAYIVNFIWRGFKER